MRLERALFGYVLRAVWPFVFQKSGREDLSSVFVEPSDDGVRVWASDGYVLSVIDVLCSDHGLDNPVRLSRDSCMSIARGVCKFRVRNQDDRISLRREGRHLVVQAYGVYAPLTTAEDVTKVRVESDVPFPDVGNLVESDGEAIANPMVSVAIFARVGVAVSQLVKCIRHRPEDVPVVLRETPWTMVVSADLGVVRARFVIPLVRMRTS